MPSGALIICGLVGYLVIGVWLWLQVVNSPVERMKRAVADVAEGVLFIFFWPYTLLWIVIDSLMRRLGMRARRTLRKRRTFNGFMDA